MGYSLGAVASVTWFRDADYYRQRPWRGRWATAGGGALINQAIHTLDLLLWCLGDARDVRGRASTLFLDDVIEVEDTASVVLTHPERDSFGLPGHQQLSGGRSGLHRDPHRFGHAAGSTRTSTVTHAGGRRETIAKESAPTGEKAYWGGSTAH